MLTSLLLCGLIVLTAINCLYYLIFAKFSFSKSVLSKNNFDTPVSVIVYTKNQASIIPAFLEQFSSQSHKNYELILIDNASQDNTRDVFELFQKNHSNVSIVNVQNNETFWGSKKYALTLGIKKATHNNLLFTTPKATIKDPDWIVNNTSLLNTKKQIIIGYTYFKKTAGFFNLFIRFSELYRTLRNFGLGTIIKPFSGSDTNFAYSKSLFLENNGFSNHMSIFEGAEDLFLKQNATSKNTVINTNKKATVELNHLTTFSKWLTYKAEQLKLTKKYSINIQFFCNLFEFSQFLFLCIAILSAIFIASPLVIGIIFIRYVTVGLVLTKTAFKLRDPKTTFFFPLLEFFYCLAQIPIFIRSLFLQ